ncbi:MAG: hypothetical protein QG622_1801 [Actinomycetota bacterium]|nr:hypothetical protein [Actinomycetota bacterium]
MFPATRNLAVGARTGAALLTAVVLTGCGGELVSTGPTTGAASKFPSTSAPAVSNAAAQSPAGAAHNAADISFATRMIPHNVQSLATTQLIATKATKEQVKTLAAGISKNGLPEIESLSQWLTSWGQPVPSGMIASGRGAVGISQEDLNQLSRANGTAFDALWLNLMLRHQQNAVTLAKEEIAGGQNPETKALAQKVLKDREAGITTMKALLAT